MLSRKTSDLEERNFPHCRSNLQNSRSYTGWKVLGLSFDKGPGVIRPIVGITEEYIVGTL